VIDGGQLELFSHVELARAGWWDRASKEVAATALNALESGESSGVRDYLRQCGVRITLARVDEVLGLLVESGDAVEAAGVYRLSAECKQRRAAAVRRSEDQVRALAVSYNEKLGELSNVRPWGWFETKYLYPVLDDLGVQTYRLLIDKELGQFTSYRVDEFLGDVAGVEREMIRDAVLDFLSSVSDDLRSFLVSALSTKFVLNTLGLKRTAIDTIQGHIENPSEILVFLDTNVLFSILGLQKNPLDDAAIELPELARLAQNVLQVRLFVTADTVDETKRVLEAAKSAAADILFNRSLLKGISHRPVAGLVGVFLERWQELGEGTTAANYFDRFIDGLTILLESEHGIEVWTGESPKSTEPQLVEDLLDLRDAAIEARPNGPDPYKKAEHDAVLWHTAYSQRPRRIDSPLRAVSWVVTLDSKLFRFDKKKRRRIGELGLCIDPSSLFRLLQFWIPVDGNHVEKALLSSLRIPFSFSPFDNEMEATTVRILSAASRLPNIDSLSDSTRTQLLANEALRNQLRGSPRNDESDLKVVHAYLLGNEQQLLTERDQISEEAEELRRQTADLNSMLERTRLELNLREQEGLAAAQDRLRAEADRADLEITVQSLQAQQSELRRLVDEQAAAAVQRSRQLGKFLVWSSLLVLTILIIVVIGASLR
jgi:hypothetical protein